MRETTPLSTTERPVPDQKKASLPIRRWGRLVVWMNSTGSAVQALAGIGSLVLLLGYFLGDLGGKETLVGLLTFWGIGVGLAKLLRSARGH